MVFHGDRFFDNESREFSSGKRWLSDDKNNKEEEECFKTGRSHIVFKVEKCGNVFDENELVKGSVFK